MKKYIATIMIFLYFSGYPNKVNSIDNDNKSIEDQSKSSTNNQPIISNSLNLIGITFGLPGIINFDLGYYYKSLGIQGSTTLFYLFALRKDENSIDNDDNYIIDTKLITYQVNINYLLNRDENRFISLSLATGGWYSLDNKKNSDIIKFFYIGPCLHFFYKRFFSELGVGYGRDYYKKNSYAWPIFQIGYMKILKSN